MLDEEESAKCFNTIPEFERYLIHPANWIHRRVESITFSSATTMRRKCSIDFDVHPALPTLISNPKAKLVPVANLEKRNLVRLDVRNESGAAIPVLTTEENSELSIVILHESLKSLIPELRDKIDLDQLRSIVKLPTGEASWRSVNFMSSFSNEIEQLKVSAEDKSRISNATRSLLDFFAKSFLLVVIFEAEFGERRIVKLAYDQPVNDQSNDSWSTRLLCWLGWKDRLYDFDTPSAADCQSFHLELICPDGLTLRDWSVKSSPTPTIIIADSRETRTAHLHYENPRGNSLIADASYGLSRNGWLKRSMIVGTLISLVMLACALRGPTVFPERPNSAAVLMGLVALAAALLVRGNDHPMGAQMLKGLTFLTFVIIALPAVGAMALLFNICTPDRVFWVVLAVLAGICATIVSIACWRP